MTKSKPTILVTGGAGYIGSVLTEALLASGWRVTVLDNFAYGQSSLLSLCSQEDLQIVRGDCRDESLIEALLKGQDVIIPLAAVVGAPACDANRVAAETINLGAIRLLCRLAARSQRILFPVSNSGYGIGTTGKFCTEESPLRPVSFYGQTKVQAEAEILDRGNAITFRLATAFGASPRMRIDLGVNDFVYRAVSDRAVVVFEGHFKRNYIHVRDVGGAFVHGLANFEAMRDRPYNVGLEDANLSKLELCEAIRKIVPGFVFLEAPIGEDPDKRDYIVSNSRLLATGFKPEWSLERGIRELVKCYTVLGRINPYGNV